MQLAVTVRYDDEIEEIKSLLALLRKSLPADQVVVRQAPKNVDYPFDFPLVTVSEGPMQGRHFGSEAIEVLRDLSKARIARD